jgi:AcrR family transcriptional regulator
MASIPERRTGRPTTDESTALREDILQQTLVALRTVGSEGLSVDKLAEQINVTKRTIYRHFKSKAGLIDAAVSCEIDRLLRGMEQHDNNELSSSTAIDHLKRWIKSIFDFISTPETQAFRRFIAFEAANDPVIGRRHEEWYQRLFDRSCSLIAAAQEEGMIGSGSLPRLTLLLFDLVISFERRSRLTDQLHSLGEDDPDTYFHLRWSAFLSLAGPNPWFDFLRTAVQAPGESDPQRALLHPDPT